jgi:hypothetical protein
VFHKKVLNIERTKRRERERERDRESETERERERERERENTLLPQNLHLFFNPSRKYNVPTLDCCLCFIQ